MASTPRSPLAKIGTSFNAWLVPGHVWRACRRFWPFYHFRSNSASQDNRRLLTDARVVVDRGHGRDPRVPIAAQVHAEGRDPAYRNLALYYIVTYQRPWRSAQVWDALDLLDIGDFPRVPNLLPGAVADIIRGIFTDSS